MSTDVLEASGTGPGGAEGQGPFDIVLAALERLLAPLVALDPETLDRVQAISGRVIAIDLVGLDRTVFVLPENRTLRFCGEHAGEVHVRIRGTPLALLNMARDRERGAVAGEVEIIGDLALGRHLQALFSSFDVDWEEWLSGFVGDVGAHQIGNLGRALSGWLRDTRTTLELDLSEYLRHELRLVVEGRDLGAFMEGVDVLRSDVDRLEVRLRRLHERLGKTQR